MSLSEADEFVMNARQEILSALDEYERDPANIGKPTRG